MRQVEIRNGKEHQCCWVDEDKPFRVGSFLTLKDCEGFWEVLKIWDTSVERASLYKPWKVGGLG